MNPIAGQFTSIEQVNDQYLKRQNIKQSQKSSDISFEDVLCKQQSKAELQSNSGVRFSKHASQRLETRNIQLSSEQSARLEDGVLNVYINKKRIGSGDAQATKKFVEHCQKKWEIYSCSVYGGADGKSYGCKIRVKFYY